MQEIGFPQHGPSPLYSDSMSTMLVSGNEASMGRSAYLRNKLASIHDAVRRRRIIVKHLAGHKNFADVLTKYLAFSAWRKHYDYIHNCK